MTTRVQMLNLVTAGIAGAVSASNWRKARSAAARRSSLAGVFVSLAILLAVVPGLAFPQLGWLRSVASVLSIGLSTATFAIIIWSSQERHSPR